MCATARACCHMANSVAWRVQVVRGGELLLMDAGCERHGYASDVTRTWPVSGKFSPEQRAVYEVVLQIHR